VGGETEQAFVITQVANPKNRAAPFFFSFAFSLSNSHLLCVLFLLSHFMQERVFTGCCGRMGVLFFLLRCIGNRFCLFGFSFDRTGVWIYV